MGNGSSMNENPTDCPDGLLFNNDTQVCDHDYNVHCPTSTVPTISPTAAPTLPLASHTTSPTEKPAICPYEFSGLIATSDCRGYYHCVNGDLAVESPTDCPAGTLFSNDLQVCDWDYNVDCPSNSITSAPTVSSSAAPTVSSSTAPTVSATVSPTLPLASSTTNPTEESA